LYSPPDPVIPPLLYESLKKRDLNEARRLVAWHLVSRDTSSLEVGHVASATIESVAENLGDGIVGPIFWWVLGGLPGVPFIGKTQSQ
jgi:adenosylcobinamide-phosphate synthase